MFLAWKIIVVILMLYLIYVPESLIFACVIFYSCWLLRVFVYKFAAVVALFGLEMCAVVFAGMTRCPIMGVKEGVLSCWFNVINVTLACVCTNAHKVVFGLFSYFFGNFLIIGKWKEIRNCWPLSVSWFKLKNIQQRQTQLFKGTIFGPGPE